MFVEVFLLNGRFRVKVGQCILETGMVVADSPKESILSVTMFFVRNSLI